MDIYLNFINQTSDFNGEVVIFQKNLPVSFDDLAVAWKTINYCGPGDNHPFSFPMTMQVSASDSYGNYTPQLTAQNGQLFQMALTASGDRLIAAGAGTSPKEVQVVNNLPQGAIDVNIYKAGRLLAIKTSVVPQQKALFEFKPTIWIGVASQIVEGQVMNSATISSINTEISLLGIARADIVMTGGGSGRPYSFALGNIVMI